MQSEKRILSEEKIKPRVLYQRRWKVDTIIIFFSGRFCIPCLIMLMII